MIKIEMHKYPSDEPICGFVVEDHIADAATTLLMAIFADRCKPAEKEISEIEFLREKIEILEQRIQELEDQPRPCLIEPWRITGINIMTGGHP